MLFMVSFNDGEVFSTPSSTLGLSDEDVERMRRGPEPAAKQGLIMKILHEEAQKLLAMEPKGTC